MVAPSVRDPRVPLSPPRARVLSAVASLGGLSRPVTLAEVTEVLGGHPNTSRQHLDALAAAGLLDVTDVPRATSGRRPHGFSLTDTGRRALAPSGEEGYREIVSAVAAHHTETGAGPRQAERIGELWGSKRAADLEPRPEDPVTAVTDMLAMLGFEPMPAPDGDGLVLRACPLHGIVADNAEFTCSMHEGMVRGVVRRLGGNQTVRLLPMAVPEGCRLLFGPPAEDAGPTAGAAS